MTADPEEFPEASQWFRSRIPYTIEQYDALDDKTRKQAFWLSANLEMDGVQTIFDELADSQEKGTPFEEFQKRVDDKLGKLAPDGHHLETVYRNWVQTSYNTGRWYQLQDPELVLLRPYLMMDVVLDDRTTDHICRPVDGVIKRHDDPWWLTNWPPRHHRCRTSVRSLRTKEALQRGVTQGDPEGDGPQGDFGKAPPLAGDGPLEPKESRFDPEVFAEFKKRQVVMLEELAAANKAAEAARLIRDQQTPEYWFEREYKELYGGAGRAVAWGRAMEHRGLELTPKKALAEHAKLVDIGVHDSSDIGPSLDAVIAALPESERKKARTKKTLRELVQLAHENGLDIEASDIRGLASLVGHSTSIEQWKKGSLEFHDVIALPDAQTPEDELERLANMVTRFYEVMSDATAKHPTGLVLYSTNSDRGQTSFFGKTRRIDAGKGDFPTGVHEWAHALDFNDPQVAARALEFRDRRTTLEVPQRMRQATGTERYEADEITKKDGFYKPYMGKVYDEGHLQDFTEVTTMAVQALTDMEPGRMVVLDPDTLYFALGQLAGSKLP